MAESDPRLHTGLQYHQASDLESAEAYYQRVLADDPSSPNALHLLGLLHYHRQAYDKADQLIFHALAGAPVWATFPVRA